jgi:EAL domain-containing protein (putative c-di-GMP-specific phosphodiesterase class I)
VDDYGTGFSSLEHLLKLNIDILKIDGSLIQSLPQPHAMAIVQSVVFFAKQLNITTVAEFVSRADLLECVTDLQIDYAQGFYIGQPQPTLQTQPLEQIKAINV